MPVDIESETDGVEYRGLTPGDKETWMVEWQG